MIRISILSCILTFLLARSEAQQSPYDTSTISPSLKKNAALVVRTENIEFEVSDIDHAKLIVHRVATILNEKGKGELLFLIQTDKFITLDDVEIKVYNAVGKIINKYKQRDLNAIAVADGLIDDYKTYYLNIPVTTFPVTVEYNYKIKYKGT